MKNNKRVLSSAIILLGGEGKRMKIDVKKQYINIKGFPIIYYTIKAFEKSNIDEIVLVVPKGEEELVRKDIVDFYSFSKVKTIVEGGSERIWSVKNGLLVSKGEYVLIHDGVRPLISTNKINSIIKEVQKKRRVILALPSKDTIKIVKDGKIEKTVDRKTAYIIQTPQAFLRDDILDSYKKIEKNSKIDITKITDDAMLLELTGKDVYVTMGDYSNIKLTTKEDIDTVESLLSYYS